MQEWTGWDGACALFKLIECSGTILEEVKCLDEYVGSNFAKLVLGNQEGFGMLERMLEDASQLV